MRTLVRVFERGFEASRKVWKVTKPLRRNLKTIQGKVKSREITVSIIFVSGYFLRNRLMKLDRVLFFIKYQGYPIYP